jgi:hypothetical protein
VKNWVQQLIDRKIGRAQEEPLQLHRAMVMSHSCEYLFRDIIAQIQGDLEKWNALSDRHDSVTLIELMGSFKFFRPGPNPAASITIGKNGNAHIDLEYYLGLSYESGEKEWNEHLTITIDKNDLCVLSHRGKPFSDLTAVSQFILEPLLDPEKHFFLH